MARVTLSICFPPEDAALLQAYKEDGGNISALVARLVHAHFSHGRGGDPKMVGVLSAELQGRISSLQDEIGRLTADMAHFKTYAEEAKAAEAEQAASLDATIRQIFSEIDAVGLAAWRRDVIGYNGNDVQFGHIVRVRCGLVASRAGLSESETAAAVLRLYPDLEGYL